MKSDGTRFGWSVRAIGLCLFSIASLRAHSVELARESNFEIAAQSLSAALLQFSQQADLQVVTSGRRIAGAASHGVTGRYTVAQALDQLLAGTGFTYQTIGEGTISVVASEAAAASSSAQAGSTGSRRRLDAIGPQRARSTQSNGADSELGPSAPSEVVVTGTRVADRTIAESLSPIDVVSTSSLSNSGTPEVNQQLSRLLPAFNFPRPSITDGTDHIRPAQLRGLSPDQTLVLIDGKRRHTSAIVNLNSSIGRGSSPVDLNALPMSAIQRIEVLRDGASAQYGSDAIAGVINMILREASTGGSMDLRYGEYGAGDGRLMQASGWIGLPLASEGFLTLSAEFRERGETDRSGADPRQMYPSLPGGQPDPREATVDRNVFQYGDPKMDDRIVFVNGGVPFGNDKELYFFANYSDRSGVSPGFFRRPLDAHNIPEIYPNGYLPFITSQVDDSTVVTGVRGALGDWLWDASLNYGGNRFRFGVENSLNSKLGAASPTSFYDGTLDNDEMLANLDVVRQFEPDWLPSSLNLALGAEFRRESYQIQPGEPSSYYGSGSEVFPGFKPEDAVNTNRQSEAAYVEIETRLTDKLAASAAVRQEDYSDFGGATSTKLAMRYAVTPLFALRATGSTGFRAPSLAQQNYSATATIFTAGSTSPVDIHTFRASNPIAKALGAEPLDKEKSRNFTIGAVTQPFSNLYFTVDLYDIRIDDRIVLSENLTGVPIQEFLAANGFPNTDGGRYFTNAVDTSTMGLDVLGRYTGTLTSGAKLAVTLAYNWNKTEIDQIAPPPQVLVENGFNFERVGRQERGRITDGSPRDKLILGADYGVRALELHLNGTRYGKWVDVASKPIYAQSFSPEVVVDVAANYRLQKQMSVTLGADNVTDAYPDQLKSGNNFLGILPYSPMSPFGFSGAFYYMKLRYDFGL
jgi:iron complex outermembrane receptor protein